MSPYQPIGTFVDILRRTFLLFLICMAGCGHADMGADTPTMSSSAQRSVLGCSVASVRYPTNLSDFGKLYDNRGFYTDGNHLGRDIALAEGTAVYPIACGSVRYFRSASGYGQLAVVVEHTLPHAVTVTNGLGANVSVTSFLTIYGHLRKSPTASGTNALTHKTDDLVSSNAPIGYVDGDATNGDGGVHLHFGVRLQSLSDAMAKDADWFRGYDDPYVSQRRWFADPALFMDALLKAGVNVRWHPPGTVIERQKDKSHWLIKSDGVLLSLSTDVETKDRLAGRAISVSDAEFGCLGKQSGSAVSELDGHRLVRFADASAVYEYTGITNRDKRWTFLNAESFQSWGWTFGEVETWAALLRPDFIQSTTDQGYRRLRDGSLVKAKGNSEASVVSGNQRLPIYDWATFLALGYKAEQVIELDASVLDVSAGSRGAIITPELVTLCHHPETYIADCPAQGPGGGGIENAGGSSGTGGSSASTMLCTPDVQKVCPCMYGVTAGRQACAEDGMSYGPCICTVPPVPDAGVTSIQTGSGGAGGAASTSIVTATGGTGGASINTGGSAGSITGASGSGGLTSITNGGAGGSGGFSSLGSGGVTTFNVGGASGNLAGGSSGLGGATQGSGGAVVTGGTSGNIGSGGATQGVGGSPPASNGGSSGVGGSPPPPVVTGPLHLRYSGPFSGPTSISGWWAVPGSVPVSWRVITECVDLYTGDAILECDLPVPSGASPFEFQVNLPGAKYWGDEACDSGGCGNTLGTVTLTKGGNTVSYTLTPNGSGPPYYNGRVAVVP
jgi:hypothetical protein